MAWLPEQLGGEAEERHGEAKDSHLYWSLFRVAAEKDQPVKGPRKQAWIQSRSISEQEGPALL